MVPLIPSMVPHSGDSPSSSGAHIFTVVESVALAGYTSVDIDFPSTRRFQLHRIEEESDHDETTGSGQVSARGRVVKRVGCWARVTGSSRDIYVFHCDIQ